MFTLGNKEAIVNATGQYTPKAIDGAAIGDGLGLDIFNFGAFGANTGCGDVIKQAFTPETIGSGVMTVPSADEIGVIGVRQSVTMLIRVNTSRFASEWATDFIRRGRPFVFELELTGTDTNAGITGDTAAEVLAKIEQVFLSYEKEFTVTDYKDGSLPWMYNNISGVELTLTLKAGDLSFGGTVTFMRKNDTFGLVLNETLTTWVPGPVFADGGLVSSTTSVTTPDLSGSATAGYGIIINEVFYGNATGVNDAGGWDPDIPDMVNQPTLIVTGDDSFAGSEALVDGKYLEENVRMSTGDYVDGAYSIKPGERPVITAPYILLSWTYTAPIGGGVLPGWEGHKRLGLVAVDLETGAQTMKYSMYFNADVFTSDGGLDIANVTGDALTVYTWLP